MTQLYIYILFHYGLSQDTEYSSLCYTVGPCCLSILNVIVFQIPTYSRLVSAVVVLWHLDSSLWIKNPTRSHDAFLVHTLSILTVIFTITLKIAWCFSQQLPKNVPFIFCKWSSWLFLQKK